MEGKVQADGQAFDTMMPLYCTFIVPLAFILLQGLTADGFLLANDSEGRPYELSPDGNR